MEALVSPFPNELTTPPVTKICLVIDLKRLPLRDWNQIEAGKTKACGGPRSEFTRSCPPASKQGDFPGKQVWRTPSGHIASGCR